MASSICFCFFLFIQELIPLTAKVIRLCTANRIVAPRPLVTQDTEVFVTATSGLNSGNAAYKSSHNKSSTLSI